MKKLFLVLILVNISNVIGRISAFAQKSNPEAPKEEYLQDTVKVQKQLSNFSIPVDIALADIEKQVNTTITGLIYEDNSYTDNDNDLFKTKVWKRGNIVISAATNDVFDFVVPLKVWAEKGYSVFGITQYQSTTFEMNLKFSTKFQINPDWTVKTITSPNGYEWITKPVLKFGSIEIPIAPIIGKIISNNHQTFASSIDDAVAKNIAIKPYVIQAWNMLKQPYQVSEEYRTWVRVEPLELIMTPLKTIGRNIKATIGLKAYTETIIGDKPAIKPPVANIPNLKTAATIPSEFQVMLVNNIPFSEATLMAKKMFVGEKFEFKEGKYNIEVTDLNIYGSNEFLVIKTDIKGSLKGTVYVKGIPVYDAVKQKVVLTNTQLDIKTKNILVKTAAWLLEGKLEQMIQDEYGVPMGELITYAKQSIETSMNAEHFKGVKTTGKITEVIPDTVALTPDGIMAIVKAKGQINLMVNGL